MVRALAQDRPPRLPDGVLATTLAPVSLPQSTKICKFRRESFELFAMNTFRGLWELCNEQALVQLAIAVCSLRPFRARKYHKGKENSPVAFCLRFSCIHKCAFVIEMLV